METTQVKQLKVNVTNINSFLKTSNKNYITLKKSNKRIISEQTKQKKLLTKEGIIEKKSISSPFKKIKDVVKSSTSLFDKIFNFGGILLTGILVNALPSIKEKIDKFAAAGLLIAVFK